VEHAEDNLAHYGVDEDRFRGIRSVDPTYLLVDTAVIQADQPVVRIRAEDVERPGNASAGALAHDGRMLVGRPSPAALGDRVTWLCRRRH
jgi:hypothetical protein